MDEQQIYGQYAGRYEEAFEATRRMYATMHPPPERVTADREGWFIPLALVLMIAASVLVSGSRTLAEFGGGLIGFAATVMLEGAIIAYAFFRKRRNFNEAKLHDTHKLASRGLMLAISVAIVANLHAVLRDKGVGVSEWVNTGILLAVGVSAPVLAFISGDILAIEVMAKNQRQARVDDEYAERMKGWNEGLLEYWRQQRGKLGVKFDAAALPTIGGEAALPAPENGVNLRQFTSIDRPSPKLKLALDWLREHPEHLNTESRKLGELIGVSHSTANKAQHILLSEQNQESGG